MAHQGVATIAGQGRCPAADDDLRAQTPREQVPVLGRVSGGDWTAIVGGSLLVIGLVLLWLMEDD